MPKNLGLYNNSLSVPRKQDIDKVTEDVGAVQSALASKQDKITVNGIVQGDGTGNLSAAETVNADLLDLNPTVVGLGNVDNVKQYSVQNPPPYPVTSVNSKTGAVVLTANDVGALPSDTVVPTVNDATLTIRRNGIDVGSFTANSADNVDVDIQVPTNKSDVGLGNVDNVRQYSADNPPPYPVTSVNGMTGNVTVDSGGVKIQLSTTQPTEPSKGDFWYEITGIIQ